MVYNQSLLFISDILRSRLVALDLDVNVQSSLRVPGGVFVMLHCKCLFTVKRQVRLSVFNICLNASPSPSVHKPHKWSSTPLPAPNDICGFPDNYAPVTGDWQQILCICFFRVCVNVRVCASVQEKTLRLLFRRRSGEFGRVESSLLAWIRRYRNGMRGSDITFLVVFHHKTKYQTSWSM